MQPDPPSGFDAARALAYDPEVLVPVSFVASAPRLDWEDTVAACRNEQAEPDLYKFADLARSRQRVAVMTEDSAEARQSPRWQNLIVPDGFRQELRAVAVDDHGYCWGSVTALSDGRQPAAGASSPINSPFNSPDGAAAAKAVRPGASAVAVRGAVRVPYSWDTGMDAWLPAWQ